MQKIIRLFLSSTFGDFQFEREALKERVWSELEAYCAARGASFEVVDLRWGISESDGLAHDTVRICLDEIAHCQKLSPKPNFLMLLGDRYGWRPLPPEIPADEFDQILATLDDPAGQDAQLLKDWYRRDNNAVPPAHILRPRGDAHRAYADWQPIEDQLLHILRLGATRLGLTPERRERYLYSATHQEIVRGALAIGDADQHVFACLRDLPDLDPQTPSARRYTDFDAHGQVDTDAASLRQELRNQVAACLPAHHSFHYPARWQGRAEEPISTAHLEPLCTDILTSLRRVIDQELDTATGDTLDQEVASHRAIGADRARLFIGRTAQRAQLAESIQAILTLADETPAPQSLLIHGPGGSGKSAFMARALADIQQSPPEATPGTVVIERFIGTTPRSIDLATFLRDLLTELARRYGKDEPLPEGDLKELIEALPERLAWATPEQPLILVIDALDQFTDNFHARQHQWLPKELPPHVALVLSVLDGPLVASLQQRHPNVKAIPLPAFTPAEGEAMLDALLAQGSDRPRRLTPTQKAMVLDAFKGDGRPLYLALAANACRRWRSWNEPTRMPDRLEALIRRFVDELKDTHGQHIADRALDYLCAARFGVSDQEMRDLLWRDQEAKAEFDQRKNPDQPEVDSLPTVIWSRLYFDIAPYLAEQGTTGALLYRFYHRIIGEEIAAYTLADDAQLVHGRIADYFHAQPLHLHTHDSQTPNLRKLSEEPWQRIQAKQLDKAEQILTDFSFVMAKCEADQVNDLLQDYRSLIEAHRRTETPISDTLRMWEAFFRERAHILRRGCAEWPAHKILLQLATEHADDSPVTIQAEEWLEQGNCDWVWLRLSKWFDQPSDINSFTTKTLELHSRGIDGAILVGDYLVTWTEAGEMCRCDMRDPVPVPQVIDFRCYRPHIRPIGDLLVFYWNWDPQGDYDADSSFISFIDVKAWVEVSRREIDGDVLGVAEYENVWYFFTANRNAKDRYVVGAYQASETQPVWEIELPVSDYDNWTTALLLENRIVLRSRYGSLILLNPMTGLVEVRLEGISDFNTVLHNGMEALIVASLWRPKGIPGIYGDGRLKHVNLNTGTQEEYCFDSISNEFLTYKAEVRTDEEARRTIMDAVFLPDGEVCLLLSKDELLIVSPTNIQSTIKIGEHPDAYRLFVTPLEGVVSAGHDGTLRLYEKTAGQWNSTWSFLSNVAPVSAMHFGDEGKLIVCDDAGTATQRSITEFSSFSLGEQEAKGIQNDTISRFKLVSSLRVLWFDTERKLRLFDCDVDGSTNEFSTLRFMGGSNSLLLACDPAGFQIWITGERLDSAQLVIQDYVMEVPFFAEKVNPVPTEAVRLGDDSYVLEAHDHKHVALWKPWSRPAGWVASLLSLLIRETLVRFIRYKACDFNSYPNLIARLTFMHLAKRGIFRFGSIEWHELPCSRDPGEGREPEYHFWKQSGRSLMDSKGNEWRYLTQHTEYFEERGKERRLGVRSKVLRRQSDELQFSEVKVPGRPARDGNGRLADDSLFWGEKLRVIELHDLSKEYVVSAWHSNCDVYGRFILGGLVVACTTSGIVLLKLFRGNQPISRGTF